MRKYELSPTDGKKSFYGKCYVIENGGAATLYSYNTAIMRRNADGSFTRIWNGYSATTGRHIKAFCGMNKAEFTSLTF